MEWVGVSKLLTGTVHRRLVELCGHSGSSSGAHSPAVVAPDFYSLLDKSFQKLALTDPAENLFGIVSGLCSWLVLTVEKVTAFRHWLSLFTRHAKYSKYLRLTSPQMEASLNSTHKTSVSTSTVKRRLRDAGLPGRVAKKKPYLCPVSVLFCPS